jgi:hypothetical protein
MTYRQMRTWLYWSEEHFSDPDINSYYLMQIASYVHALGTSKVQAVNKYRITFRKPKKLTREERIRHSKSKWLGGMGKKVVVVKSK